MRIESNSKYIQSAVIPFRVKNNQIEILLITSLNSGKWIFPKGIVEDNLTAQESALKEAFEEAGVEGEVLDILIGDYSYDKWGGTCHVQVYPLHVKKIFDQWLESGERKRCWTSQDEALNLVEKPDLKKLLLKFNKLSKSLKSYISNDLL